MRRFALIAALAVLAAAASARSEVQPTASNQAAQRCFESGVGFYRSGDYESARIEFEADYCQSKLHDFLANLFHAPDKHDRFEDSINCCASYLRIEPNAKDSSEVRAQMGRLNQQLGSPARQTSLPSPQRAPSGPAAFPNISAASTPLEAPAPATVRSRTGALALLIGGGELLAGGAGGGAGALITTREIESGTAFDVLAGLERCGDALNLTALSLCVAGGVAVAAGARCLAFGEYTEGR